MRIDENFNKDLVDIFYNLVKIPSPSRKEDVLIAWLENFLSKNNINYRLDDYKNVIINLPANNSNAPSILLSSHMDVVGDNSPINLVEDGEFLKTDGSRTLGADDKVGVAVCLMIALEQKKFNHGEIEIMLTRDEETGMSGIKNADLDKLNSKYALVLDADKFAQFQISGASYTNLILYVEAYKGGHSGIDIADISRVNATKLVAELVAAFPQGVFFADETGVITSINIGSIVAGGVQNCVKTISDEKIVKDDFAKFIAENSSTNIINTNAYASFSIRSASVEKENELNQGIQNIISDFNKKYDGLAVAKTQYFPHIPAFQKSEDTYLQKLYEKACAKLSVKPDISSFHAGAETHIYAQSKNAKGETFLPILMGCADVFNMHSSAEKVNLKTMCQGFELIKEMLKD